MSYITVNGKCFIQVYDFKRERMLPHLQAGRKNPYRSSTLRLPPAVTHKVIHRRCAELCVSDSYFRISDFIMPKICAGKVYCDKSMT